MTSRAMVFEDRVQRANLGPLGVVFRSPSEVRMPTRRPALVAVQLALAHAWAETLECGGYGTRAELATAVGLTLGRVSQLMDLVLLAPSVQEEVLFLEAVDGQEPLGERSVRSVLRAGDWHQQWQAWKRLLARGDRRRAAVRAARRDGTVAPLVDPHLAADDRRPRGAAPLATDWRQEH